jgi:hypothetical protein
LRRRVGCWRNQRLCSLPSPSPILETLALFRAASADEISRKWHHRNAVRLHRGVCVPRRAVSRSAVWASLAWSNGWRDRQPAVSGSRSHVAAFDGVCLAGERNGYTPATTLSWACQHHQHGTLHRHVGNRSRTCGARARRIRPENAADATTSCCQRGMSVRLRQTRRPVARVKRDAISSYISSSLLRIKIPSTPSKIRVFVESSG